MSNFNGHTNKQQLRKYAQKSLVLLLFGLFINPVSMAIGTIELSIEQLLLPLQQTETQQPTKSESPVQALLKQLQLQQLTATLDIAASPATLTITLDELNLPEPFSGMKELFITCLSLGISTSSLTCTQGTAAIRGLFEDQLLTSADFVLAYHPQTGVLSFQLNNMDVGNGRFAATIEVDKNQWQVAVNADNLDYQSVQQYLHYYFKETFAALEEPSAQVSFSAQLSGQTGAVDSTGDGTERTKNLPPMIIDIQGQVRNLKYVYLDDLAENLNFDFVLKLDNSPDETIKVSSRLDNITGELFQNNIYVAFSGEEQLIARLNYQTPKQSLDIKHLSLKLPKILDVNTSGRIDLAKADNPYQLHTQFKVQDFSLLNKQYLVNMLEGTDYEGLEISGAGQGKFHNSHQLMDIHVSMNELSVTFNDQIAIDKLNGQIHWNNKNQSLKSMPESQLSWQGMTLNQLPLGATRIKFKAQDDRLILTDEADIPVFDGALHINTLQLSEIGQTADADKHQSGMNIAIDGLIRPVSLEQVSGHFDWPILDGKLSAVIPYTTYNEHLLEVGGALMMQVFDGVIIVKDLKIEQPLSEYARLYANIDLNNLNLRSLTKTYNFGEIEGRVEGKFTDLVLQSWQPVAFDAYIRTPADDKSNHKISQRAIDNLSSLGGASGILSRSFLSFFETFRYDKLGLSCKLKNNICKMNGIESSSNGNSYYIVKGGGIPRIDVMGFQRQVNWQVLTSRLKAIQSANEAVIE